MPWKAKALWRNNDRRQSSGHAKVGPAQPQYFQRTAARPSVEPLTAGGMRVIGMGRYSLSFHSGSRLSAWGKFPRRHYLQLAESAGGW